MPYHGKKPKRKVKAQERKVRRNVRRGVKVSKVNACIGGSNRSRRGMAKDMKEKV